MLPSQSPGRGGTGGADGKDSDLETGKMEIRVMHFTNLSPLTIWKAQGTPGFIVLGEEVGTEEAGKVSLQLLTAFGKDYKEESSSRGMDRSWGKSEVQDRVGLT